MPVDTQNIPISFEQGIDTKTDPKQLVPGKMVYLNNASFVSPKQIKKRDGFQSITNNILGGGTVTSGYGIASYKNELIELDGSTVYSYSPEDNKQVTRSIYKPITLTTQSVVRNTYAQNDPDMAVDPVTGLQAFVYYDQQSDGVNYSIIDGATGTIIVNNAVLRAAAPSLMPVSI